jgi:VanZ family protein
MPFAIGRRLLLWGPAALYMCFIFFLSSESDPLPGLTSVIWDKALHGTGYAALAALLARAGSGEGWSWRRAWLFGILAASAYGMSDEFHQSFVAGRDADVLDWVADTVGAGVGATLFVGLLAVWHRQIVSRWPALAWLHPLVGTRDV